MFSSSNLGKQHVKKIQITVSIRSQLFVLSEVSASQSEPRSMKWESSGELAQRDLSELVNRLLDVESSNNSDELTRLSSKYDEEF